jgi:hypothetical protein
MTQLDDIPNELLLNIANQFVDGPQPIRQAQHDLCSLALSSRHYKAIAQEVLHSSVAIRAPAVEACLSNTQMAKPVGLSRIALLCRTLLRRPDLAKKVRQLHVFVWGAGMINTCPEDLSGNGSCAI